MEYLLDGYENDGFVYCLSIPVNSGQKRVKIGKTSMKQNKDEQQVLDALMRRYNTYYGAENYEVEHFVRVGNCTKAEAFIFAELEEHWIEREMYEHDKVRISKAFDDVCEAFPNINEIIQKMDINELSKANIMNRNLIKN